MNWDDDDDDNANDDYIQVTMITYKDARLKLAVERYGNKWVKVAADVGGDVTGKK